uniref:ethanolamine kinase n=1 Tax=Vannella robusta TaxID=1487602 RepID=A0A7S4M562_9EUKA
MSALSRVPSYAFRVPVSGDIGERKNVVRDLVATMNSHLGWDEEETKSKIKVTPYELGLTNQLYKCELEQDVEAFEKRNMEVMVRVFGKGSDEMLDREAELNIMTQVEEEYVKCKFENGIVVTFFAGECLRPLNLLEPDKRSKIAAKMALLHKVILVDTDGEPLTKNWFFRVHKWISIIEEHLPQFTTEVHGKTVNCATLRSSLEDLQTKISLKNYDVVCCHGDINAENCIFNKAENTITFIDFEYCCNFFRGFDIGNHFCEYAGVERNLDFDKYFPSLDQRTEFVRQYCESFYGSACSEDKIMALLLEADDGALLSHFFWGVWGLVQSTCSSLEFDFTDYARKRLFRFYSSI